MAVDLKAELRGRGNFGWLEHLWNGTDHLVRVRREANGSAFIRSWSRWLPARRRGVARAAQGRPLTVAGIAAGAGLLLGAAFALGGRGSSRPDNPEEIIARALCREDPDTPTHRGPLWTGYRKEARRVLAALREAGLLTDRA
jgi:hypothetical protein